MLEHQLLQPGLSTAFSSTESMTDAQITSSLATRSPLPSVSATISEFRISYQRALRCWIAAGGVEEQPEVKVLRKKVYTLGGQKPTFTMEDF